MICTFFGHRECRSEIKKSLEIVITHLIEKEDVTDFYVGNHGQFDGLVTNVLKKMEERYPNVRYAVVLAYLPAKRYETDILEARKNHTIYPEGLETVPKKYAISKRNIWMIEHCDIVVSYTTVNFGGAARYKEIAQKRGKRIIEINKLI